jgi:N-acetylmuramoyl-L-alanine amidase
MAPGQDAQSIFVNWDRVQLRYMGKSSRFAMNLQHNLEKITKVATTPPMEVPVRVLQSIAAPAVAIEVGSLDPNTSSAGLTNPSFQQEIGAAVAAAIQQLQGGQQ